MGFLSQNKELTFDALRHATESGIVALKTTFLLGGNPNPEGWDENTKAIADACFDVAEAHDLVFHFHTSQGGSSPDISNYIPMIQRYGKRVKLYLVPFGGGVSGHIRLVPKFLDWSSRATRFIPTRPDRWASPRWLLTEIERRGVGHDRVLFASDEPWSDFWGEYWKLASVPISEELKERIFHQNFEDLYG